MTATTGNGPAPPTPAEAAALKRLASGIIRVQGNRFIKELLRDKGIRIGVNKADFERNLTQAIETGALSLDDVESWLGVVEGWGNQHVYLYNISPKLRTDLTKARIRRRVREAQLEDVWDAATVLAFPDEPALTSISFTDSTLRLVWQEASPGWTPVPDKNYLQEEGLDTFEYRAWRKIERRAITRFEARVDKGLAALFIADPIQAEEHEKAVAEAKRVVRQLLDLKELEAGVVDVPVVLKNVDQRNVPTNVASKPSVKAQRSRLASGGAYVEFAAKSRDKAYWEEDAIRNVRSAVKTQQLRAFEGTDGVFIFQEGFGDLDRPLRVQLYGAGRRIRLWAQMNASEVWTILTTLAGYQ